MQDELPSPAPEPASPQPQLPRLVSAPPTVVAERTEVALSPAVGGTKNGTRLGVPTSTMLVVIWFGIIVILLVLAIVAILVIPGLTTR